MDAMDAIDITLWILQMQPVLQNIDNQIDSDESYDLIIYQ
jgi:hypothetical protein